MGIVSISNRKSLKNDAIDYIQHKKNIDKKYNVIDIGGAANTWCDQFVDCYVDLKPVPEKKVIIGDINDQDTWCEIEKVKHNFCICTHTLEDIRRPDFVLHQMIKNFDSGFISVPNKHTEFSNIESMFYIGYCHHRWIFGIENGTLKILFKYPIFNYFCRRNRFYHRLFRLPIFKLIGKRRTFWPGKSGLSWVDKEIVGSEFELSFLWEKNFSYEFVNNDYAGDSYIELVSLAYNFGNGY